MREPKEVAEASTTTPSRRGAASSKRIEANRRNALRSTGPKTSKGKDAVRWNALKHGLLAKEVVVRRGDNAENATQFQRLLESFIENLQPVGMLEGMCVERIAVTYWRLGRALRYDIIEAEQALSAIPGIEEVEQLSRYETMLDRQLYRAIDQLDRLQRRRKGEPVPPPINVDVSAAVGFAKRSHCACQEAAPAAAGVIVPLGSDGGGC